MKFGETLYRRSVPKWAAYNVNYNEIKHLIKRRTTKGIAEPLPIPGASANRWRELEDELFLILKAQHDNVSLFLRSKDGELQRRLLHLEKQVKIAQRLVNQHELRSTSQGKRYRKLLEEGEDIGEDVQALTRFAAVQKTAFRKILKKYRKWTHSIELQTRLENEVFAAGELNLDFTRPLERLSLNMKVMTEELQGPMLRQGAPTSSLLRRSSSTAGSTSIAQITEASTKSVLAFDAALAITTFGRSAGGAVYWIHPDNLDEAVVLLMRHMQELSRSPPISRHSSVGSLTSQTGGETSPPPPTATHVVYMDNAQRFLQDQAVHRPSKIAISARWCQNSEAVVAMSDLATWAAKSDTIRVKRKDLPKALDRLDSSGQRRKSSSAYAWDVLRIQEYLAQHRDVKPLGQLHSQRHRYTGLANSSQVGMWATLDRDIVIAPTTAIDFEPGRTAVESGEAFPHAVLEIRWEFGHTPEVVRAFDASHLAERIEGFSLEAAVVHASDQSFDAPSWRAMLEKDIRKVPMATRHIKPKNSILIPSAGTSSGPSSTDGPSDSVFSAAAVQSSATSDGSPESSMRSSSGAASRRGAEYKSKKVRIDPDLPSRPQPRYWNEFDDGDSDTNPQETYAIYVDPDEKFPGVDTITRAYASMSKSWHRARSRWVSWIPPHADATAGSFPNERTSLLISPDAELDTSDSDSTPTSTTSPLLTHKPNGYPGMSRSSVYRPHQTLTKRQTALETTYLQFYSGLLILAYVLLFMSAAILETGRKKARIEVDATVICGVVAAELCAATSLLLVCFRRMPLGLVHWGIVSVATMGILVFGIGLLVGVAGNSQVP